MEQAECPICQADPKQQENIWYAYADRMVLKDAFRAARRLLGPDIQWAQVNEHLYQHHWVQPAPPGRLQRNLALQEVITTFSNYMYHMLRAVWRARALSRRQLYAMFYLDSAEDGEELRELFGRDLQRLVFRSFLYQHWPENKGALQFEDPGPYYFLNQKAIPLLERLEGQELGFNDYIPSLAKIKEFNLEHDTRFLDVLVQLRSTLYNRSFNWNEERLTCHLGVEHWFPGHMVQTHLSLPSGKEIVFEPAALVALRAESHSGALSTLLPCWFEYDRSTKDLSEIVDRILAHQVYHRSVSFQNLFPRMAEHHSPGPLVVVCDSSYRRDEVAATLSGQLSGQPAAIYLTDRPTLIHDPYGEGILVAPGQQQRYSLLERLLEHNRCLIDHRAFSGHDHLTDRPAAEMLQARPAPLVDPGGLTPQPAPAGLSRRGGGEGNPGGRPDARPDEGRRGGREEQRGGNSAQQSRGGRPERRGGSERKDRD